MQWTSVRVPARASGNVSETHVQSRFLETRKPRRSTDSDRTGVHEICSSKLSCLIADTA